jgi:dynein heavy chain
MLVGQTCSGKTTCYEILQHAMIELAKQEESAFVQKRQFQEVVTSIMNPKCITMGELYGYVNIFS